MTDVERADSEATGASDAEPAPATGTGARRGRGRFEWRRIDKSLLIVSLIIGFGLFLVVRGVSVGISGEERENLPEQIEAIEPVPEAVQVPNQTRVFVDLVTGYTGVLVIDDVELETVDIRNVTQDLDVEPGQQVDLPATTIFEGGNNTLTFVPNDEAAITEFTTGIHRAQLIYWKIEEGRNAARSFSWDFNVD